MEFKVDITGNVPQRAAKDAAALRDEAAAANGAAAAVAALGKGGAALAAANDGPAKLAAEMKDAQREVTALKAALTALESSSGSMDIAAGRALNDQITAAIERASAAAGALAKTGQAGRDFAGEAAENKEREAAAKELADEEEKKRKAAQQARIEGLLRAQADVRGAKEQAVAVKNITAEVLTYGAALAGIGGLGELTKMAAGWRVMGQLQMVSARATMDLRRDMAGVDAQPLVRSAIALERNLSKSTTTGAALSGLLTRGFTGAFAAVEKLEPAVEAAVQAAVLGGLMLEGAWLKATTTLLPLTSALEDAAGDVDAVGIAAEAVTIAFKGLDGYVQTVASGIALAARGAEALNKAMGGLPAEVLRKAPGVMSFAARAPLSTGAAAVTDAAQLLAVPFGGDTNNLGGASRQSGKDIASGLVDGMESMVAMVRAAGKRLGQSGVEGAREGADAHSPSRATQRLAHDMGDGEILGFRERAGAVAEAAQKALVPDVDTGKGGARGGTSPAPSASFGGITLVFPGITTGSREAFEAAAGDPLLAGLRAACIKLGLPIPGGP